MNFIRNKSLIIIAPFSSVPGEDKFNRFLLLANLLCKSYNVTLITSNFNHNKKIHNRLSNYITSDSLNIVCIHEIGYKKNISLRRFFSHLHFSINFFLYLFKNKNLFYESNVIGAYPLVFPLLILSTCKYFFKYTLIIDINDLWPQAFGHLFPKYFRGLLNTKSFNFLAYFIFKNADIITAVSESYLHFGLQFNNKATNYILYLGGDKKMIDSFYDKRISDINEIHFAYIGALGTSYDLKTCINSFNNLYYYNGRKIFFHIIGEGPEKDSLEKIANSNIIFHGFKEYSEMIKIIKSCDYLVNPIKDGASQSVTNKLCDYILFCKPIISSQKSTEIETFFQKNVYYLYNAGNVNDFIFNVKKMIDNKAIKIYPEEIINKFDRNVSYIKFVNWLHTYI